MAISVNTSRSGSQRVLVPVLRLDRGVFTSSSPFSPVMLPFWKWSWYSNPSRQTVTSMYADAYWVAQEPRPLRPREYS